MKQTQLAVFGSVVLASRAFALDVDPAKYKRPAAFTVTDQVVNEAVEPFTATVGSSGQGWRGYWPRMSFLTSA